MPKPGLARAPRRARPRERGADRHRALSELTFPTRFRPKSGRAAARLAAETLRWSGRADRMLGPHLRQRPPEEVLNLLRLGTVELCVEGAAPHGVVDAAVTLARRPPETRRQAGLVNAVLRRVPPRTRRNGTPCRSPNCPNGSASAWSRPGARRSWRRWRPPMRPARRSTSRRATAMRAGLRRPSAGGAAHRVRPASGRGRSRRCRAMPRAASGCRTPPPRFRRGFSRPSRRPRARPLRRAGRQDDAARRHAGAEVTALDISEDRMGGWPRTSPAPGSPAEIVVADALTWDGGPFDAVLLDAPCTATGTIRRHPDLPFVKDEAQVARSSPPVRAARPGAGARPPGRARRLLHLLAPARGGRGAGRRGARPASGARDGARGARAARGRPRLDRPPRPPPPARFLADSGRHGRLLHRLPADPRLTPAFAMTPHPHPTMVRPERRPPPGRQAGTEAVAPTEPLVRAPGALAEPVPRAAGRVGPGGLRASCPRPNRGPSAASTAAGRSRPGNFLFAGFLVEAPETPIWDLPMPDAVFEAEVHGFAWLDDLAAVGDRAAQNRAQAWTHDWISRYGERARVRAGRPTSPGGGWCAGSTTRSSF
jgi:16S rRNA (cytosine967-C5)-methyltransferase